MEFCLLPCGLKAHGTHPNMCSVQQQRPKKSNCIKKSVKDAFSTMYTVYCVKFW